MTPRLFNFRTLSGDLNYRNSQVLLKDALAYAPKDIKYIALTCQYKDILSNAYGFFIKGYCIVLPVNDLLNLKLGEVYNMLNSYVDESILSKYVDGLTVDLSLTCYSIGRLVNFHGTINKGNITFSYLK